MAITFAEVVATSDVPGGVINILTGRTAELAPHLAAHADVNALDLTGADAELRKSLEQAAAETVKRVYVPKGVPDFAAAPGTARLRAFLEIKTVWHPDGALSLSGGTVVLRISRPRAVRNEPKASRRVPAVMTIDGSQDHRADRRRADR